MDTGSIKYCNVHYDSQEALIEKKLKLITYYRRVDQQYQQSTRKPKPLVKNEIQRVYDQGDGSDHSVTAQSHDLI